MSETADRIRTLKELRVGSIMTQQQAAEALGMSLSAYHRLEKGRTQPTKNTYKRIVEFFEEEVYFSQSVKTQKSRAIHYKIKKEEKQVFTLGEKKFLKTCWNMRDALKGGRMLPRDIVDATYEYMDDCEAITYLYKWYKMGFYYFPNGGTVDQGYFKWDKMPLTYRRSVEGE